MCLVWIAGVGDSVILNPQYQFAISVVNNTDGIKTAVHLVDKGSVEERMLSFD